MEKELKVADSSKDALLLADAMEDSTESAESLNKAMKKVQSTVKTTAKFVRHFVADFDELQKLPEKEMTVSTTVKTDELDLAAGLTEGQLTYRVKKVTEQIHSLFSGMVDQILRTNRQIEESARWMDHFYESILRSTQCANELMPAMQRLEKEMVTAMVPVTHCQQQMQGLAAGLSMMYSAVGKELVPVLAGMNTEFRQFLQLRGSLESVEHLWSNHWTNMAQSVRRSANDMIRYCNAMMETAAVTVNTVGKFSSMMPGSTYRPVQVTAPRLPALAQGAVLPANRPFLALVGDQRHGTNIEAPLATIQEAVAAVTADQTGAIVAGFEASVGVQKEILEAVLGISIGDDTIAKACRRYERKMAVVRGG